MVIDIHNGLDSTLLNLPHRNWKVYKSRHHPFSKGNIIWVLQKHSISNVFSLLHFLPPLRLSSSLDMSSFSICCWISALMIQHPKMAKRYVKTSAEQAEKSSGRTWVEPRLWDPFQTALLQLINGGDPTYQLGWSSKYGNSHPHFQQHHECRSCCRQNLTEVGGGSSQNRFCKRCWFYWCHWVTNVVNSRNCGNLKWSNRRKIPSKKWRNERMISQSNPHHALSLSRSTVSTHLLMYLYM